MKNAPNVGGARLASWTEAEYEDLSDGLHDVCL